MCNIWCVENRKLLLQLSETSQSWLATLETMRENGLGLCDFIDVVGVYWFSWFRGVVKWGQWIGAFYTRNFDFL